MHSWNESINQFNSLVLSIEALRRERADSPPALILEGAGLEPRSPGWQQALLASSPWAHLVLNIVSSTKHEDITCQHKCQVEN